MSPASPIWMRRLKQQLKPTVLRGRRWWARTRHAYDVQALIACVRTLGIEAGDCVLLHSGFEHGSGYTGSPGSVIDGLLELLGPEGHLLMMSMPYRGASELYAASDPLFDVRRTPSAVGLLSEILRRRDGVLRSLSPLHPVLAHGPLAAWLVSDHEQFAYSCGSGTPFARLLGLAGKFLFLDAPYGALTFMHHVEDHYRTRLPVELYAPQAARMRLRDYAGRERVVAQYFFSAEARARRHFTPIEQTLQRAGQLRHARVGNSRLACVGAVDVMGCAGELLAAGTGFYR